MSDTKPSPSDEEVTRVENRPVLPTEPPPDTDADPRGSLSDNMDQFAETQSMVPVRKVGESPPEWAAELSGRVARWSDDLFGPDGELEKMRRSIAAGVASIAAMLTTRDQRDEANWKTIKNEISGVRAELSTFKTDIRGEIRTLRQALKQVEERLDTLEREDARETASRTPTPNPEL